MPKRQTLNLSSDTIHTLLPEPPDNMLGYHVQQDSHMWYSVWLCHPPYSYKEGVRTIWGYVKRNGNVHAPNCGRPHRDPLTTVSQLFIQNPYSLIQPKDLGYSLLSLL